MGSMPVTFAGRKRTRRDGQFVAALFFVEF
jgi:hypothetical protein